MNLTEMEQTDTLNTLRKHLTNCDVNGVVNIIKENRIDLADIFPIIVSQLNHSIKIANPDSFQCSETTLKTIVEVFDPEDVLLLIIDDIKSAVDDTAFLTLTFSLLTVLVRLPKKRLSSLGWGLNAVSVYYSNIPPSQQHSNDVRIINLCSALLPFYKRLVDNLSVNYEERVILLKFTLQLLGNPLAFSNFTSNNTRQVSEKVLALLFEINSDFFSLLDLDPLYDIGKVDTLALATLFYLVLTKGIMLDKVPQVYSSVYIFQQCVPLITELLKHEAFTVHSALCFAEVLMDRLVGYILSSRLLDSEHHTGFCKTLTVVIVYNPDKNVRQRALELYKRYLFLFDNRGRYLLVYHLTTILDHSGILGYTITQYKEMLVQALNEPVLSSYFCGSNLFFLLDRFCFMKDFEETHLLQTSEKTLAVLNLLRYLALRDKENVTGIYDYFKLLRTQFLDPLKNGVALSRDLHKVKMQDLTTTEEPTVAVSVGGKNLPDLSREEKLKCLQFGVVTFDMIDDLLSRLYELINL